MDYDCQNRNVKASAIHGTGLSTICQPCVLLPPYIPICYCNIDMWPDTHSMGRHHTHKHTAKLDSETKTARFLAGSRAIHTDNVRQFEL